MAHRDWRRGPVHQRAPILAERTDGADGCSRSSSPRPGFGTSSHARRSWCKKRERAGWLICPAPAGEDRSIYVPTNSVVAVPTIAMPAEHPLLTGMAWSRRGPTGTVLVQAIARHVLSPLWLVAADTAPCSLATISPSPADAMRVSWGQEDSSAPRTPSPGNSLSSRSFLSRRATFNRHILRAVRAEQRAARRGLSLRRPPHSRRGHARLRVLRAPGHVPSRRETIEVSPVGESDYDRSGRSGSPFGRSRKRPSALWSRGWGVRGAGGSRPGWARWLRAKTGRGMRSVMIKTTGRCGGGRWQARINGRGRR
jgi:hypothetical protein